jgi:hypothetical protein
MCMGRDWSLEIAASSIYAEGDSRNSGAFRRRASFAHCVTLAAAALR